MTAAFKAWCGCLASLAATAALTSAALAQPPGRYNEREVKQQPNVQDPDDLWVLDFTFKDPRLITVDIPGRGRRVLWYLWYQVANNTGQPRTFIPDFELVTLDHPGVYHDEVLPKAQEAIRRIEDPTGGIDLKNSVTIASEPIPPSKPDLAPRRVTGVAIWDDTTKDQKLQDTTRFSIFVSGLSNGWSVDDRGTVRRKTLQLNFRRLGDRYYQDSREIRFVSPAEWIYRASPLTLAVTPPKKEEAPKPESAPPAGGGHVDAGSAPTTHKTPR
jgi:hypothetical protein